MESLLTPSHRFTSPLPGRGAMAGRAFFERVDVNEDRQV